MTVEGELQVRTDNNIDSTIGVELLPTHSDQYGDAEINKPERQSRDSRRYNVNDNDNISKNVTAVTPFFHWL